MRLFFMLLFSIPLFCKAQSNIQISKIKNHLQNTDILDRNDSIQKICPHCNILDEKLTSNDSIHPYRAQVWQAKKGEVVGPVSRGDETKCLILRGDTVSEWQARVREIYLGNVDSTEAMHIFESVKTDIKKGRKFSKCAQELSKDGAAGNGGDLGWFGPGMMVPDFENAVLSHKKGDIFLVNTAEFGWLIVEQSEDVRRSTHLNVTVVILHN